ncbi:MarR family transcriptional regulator [Tsukamurella sputi]|uniref:MarR family transcriptional regulator n=1 Tax=Tsukamurella sputi TaxID=2591848 RepID=A0A5C5RI63_9ACTN|nr:helix-turn-helix domain-containing protein [Tsukamurella sputi]TWS22324.1 MarR family transcriptional regulator [Tsukamurella sputi]
MSRSTPQSPDALAVVDLSPDARIGALARRVAALVTDGVLDAVHRHDSRIRGAHLRVLAAFATGPQRIVDIAARLGTTKQTVSPIVEELVTWGFLERAVDPTDRRAKLIDFTADGKALAASALDAAHAFEDRWRATLGVDRTEQCRAALWAIIETHG